MNVKIDLICPSCRSTAKGLEINVPSVGIPVRLSCPLCQTPIWFTIDSIDGQGAAVYRIGRELRPEEITKALEQKCPVCGRGPGPSREREYILRPGFVVERHGVKLNHKQVRQFLFKMCQGGDTPYKWFGCRDLPDGSVIFKLAWDDPALAEKGLDLYGQAIEEFKP